jgi:hypothetical protein
MVQISSTHVQHMHKALTQMNLQIHNVISDITGLTGMAIVDAILAITATAHKLARVVFYLIKTGKTYDETVFADQEKLHQQRLQRNLKKQAKLLGFQIIPCNA